MKKVLLLCVASFVFGIPNAFSQDLIGVYELALQNDPKLREAQQRRDAIRETRPQARALLLPNIGLSGSLDETHRRLSNSGHETFDQSNFALQLTQPVYHRDYWLRLSQADQVIAQAEAEYASAELDLMLRTATVYFDVLGAKDDLMFRKAETEATGRQLEQAEQRFEVGLIAITAVHEAQAAFDGARANEIQAENAVGNAWEALREITHERPEALAGMGDQLALVPPEPQDIEQWTTMAEEQNYAIVAALEASEALKKTIKIENSGHYPSLDFVGSHSISNTSSNFSSDRDDTSFGLQLSVPIYAGGAVTSRTRKAKHDYQASLEVLDQQRRAVTRNVRDAYRAVLSNISRVKALDATRRSANSAFESTQAGFEVGTRTMVDVLDAQRGLFSARANYARSRYDYILSAFQLRQSASLLSRDDFERVNGWLDK